MQLSREQIERWAKAAGVNIKGGNSGGGGGGVDIDLSSYAQKSWVEEGYVSKAFFNEMFVINGLQKVETSTDGGTTWTLVGQATAITFAPNEVPSVTTEENPTTHVLTRTTRTITDIKVLAGLWSESYLSALGQNTSGGGGGGGASTLAGLLDVQLTNPTNGQALVYDSTLGKWKNSTVSSGTDMQTVWNALAANTNEQINASHMTNALSNYLPLSGGAMTGAITRNTGGWWARARNHAIIKTTASNADTYYAAFSLKTTDGDWSIGVKADTNTLYAIYTTDAIYESDTNNPIKIQFPSTAGTLALAGDYYTKAQADAKFLTIAAFENLFNAMASDGTTKVNHPYSSGVASIKAMVGLWTNQYLSALGLNSSGGGGGGSAALYGLTDVKPNSDTTPTMVFGLAGTSADNGKVLTYSTTYNKWIAQAVSPSVDMPTVWTNLAANTNEQINVSHLTAALSGYLPLTAGSTKALTGSLYLSSRSKGIFEPYTINSATINIPLIYDNGENLWIGSTQTNATHHIGGVYISAGHNGTHGNSTIYVCVPNDNNNSGTNYGVWHTGNLNPVGYRYIGTTDPTGESGCFFFGGNNALKSGYDYVGFQAGYSEDKWQMVAIDSLQWRQNDNGGTSTVWGNWRTIVDSANLWNYAKPRLHQEKELSNAGWYRVADITSYGLSFLITFYGGYYYYQPTPVTFIVSHTYNYDQITQVGGCANPGMVDQVRLVRYANGKIYVDFHYAGTNPNTIGIEITPLDNKSANPANITIVDFTSATVGSGETTADFAITSRSGIKGIYTMNGGTQNPDYFGMNNVGFLMSKQTVNGDSTYKNWMYMDNYWGTDAGGTTAIGVSRINGRMFVMRSDSARSSWNTLREVSVYDTNGYLGVGYGNTTPQYQLDVNGEARVSGLWIGGIHITYDSTNGGLLIANGGLAASTYVSALGTNSSGGGGGVILTEPLASINQAGLATHPTSSGKTIVWNGSAWVYGTAGGATTINELTDVSIISPSSNQVLIYNASTGKWVNGSVSGVGTLSSIGLSMPTGFSVSPATLTANGSFAVSFASGYSLPTTAKQNQWDSAYTFTSFSGFGTAGTDYVPITLGAVTKNVLTDHQSLAGYATQSWVTNTALAGYATQSWVNTQGFLKTATGTFWGQSWTNGGTVTGSLSGVGSITMSGDIQMANNTAVRMKPNGGDGQYWNVLTMNNSNTLALGYYTRTHGQATDIQGSTITFAVNGGSGTASSAVDNRVDAMNIDENGRVWIKIAAQGLRIGDGLITWDSQNNALKIQRISGSSVVEGGLYATSFLSALGANSGGGGSGVGDVTWTALADSNDTRAIAFSHFSNTLANAHVGVSSLSISGECSIYDEGGDLVLTATNGDVYIEDDCTINGTTWISSTLGVNSLATFNGSIVVKYDGATRFSFSTPYTNVHLLTIDAGGIFTDSVSAPSFINTSDERKKNVVDYNAALTVDQVANAPAVHFTWKDSADNSTHVGTLAQYWRDICPEAVPENYDGFYGVDYAVLAMLSSISIARRIQELEQEIEQLKKAL